LHPLGRRVGVDAGDIFDDEVVDQNAMTLQASMSVILDVKIY